MRNGLTLMLGFFLFGLGILGGGQVWFLTGSIPLGVMGAGMVVLVLGVIFRKLGRRWKSFRFLGEVRRVVEEEFIDLVEDEDGAKARLEEKAQKRPERAASSIRSMLEKKPDRRGN